MMANHEYQNDKKIMVESIDILGLKILVIRLPIRFSKVLAIPSPILKYITFISNESSIKLMDSSGGKLPMLCHFSYADPVPPNLHN